MALLKALKQLGNAAAQVVDAAGQDIKTNPQISKAISAADENLTAARKGLAGMLARAAARLDESKIAVETTAVETPKASEVEDVK